MNKVGRGGGLEGGGGVGDGKIRMDESSIGPSMLTAGTNQAL